MPGQQNRVTFDTPAPPLPQDVTCYVLVLGKPGAGQLIYGPFPSDDDAVLWASQYAGSEIFQTLPVYGKVQP